ncbi:MAG: carbonic anhydrase family protein [Blastocatellia bacterium]|nr:carbonic anhydrase family protein [Blastocatellia bacterium]
MQFHFHGPSEHTVNGKSFPMEMHLVHVSADKKLAVIGGAHQAGKAN